MVLRALGIGPVGSLLAAGALDEHERMLVADFAEPGDRLARSGRVVTEAFRTALGQSHERHGRAADSGARRAAAHAAAGRRRASTSRVAREIATREGIKAIVDGDVIARRRRLRRHDATRLARNRATSWRRFRETADEREGADAGDRPAREELRAKIGESLKHVQARRRSRR